MPNTFDLRFGKSAGLAVLLVLGFGALTPTESVAQAAGRTNVLPIAAADRAHAAARKQLDFFEAEAAKLRAEFARLRNSPTAEPVAALEQRWWSLTERIYNSPEFGDPEIRVLLHAELAVSRSWRMALASYAQGVRAKDKKLIAAALAEIEFAEALSARVRQYVR